jgi:hypothetical protein
VKKLALKMIIVGSGVIGTVYGLFCGLGTGLGGE